MQKQFTAAIILCIITRNDTMIANEYLPLTDKQQASFMVSLFITALGWNIIDATDTQAFTQIFNDHLNPTPDTARINNVEPAKSWSLSTLITSYWPGKA